MVGDIGDQSVTNDAFRMRRLLLVLLFRPVQPVSVAFLSAGDSEPRDYYRYTYFCASLGPPKPQLWGQPSQRVSQPSQGPEWARRGLIELLGTWEGRPTTTGPTAHCTADLRLLLSCFSVSYSTSYEGTASGIRYATPLPAALRVTSYDANTPSSKLF